MKILSFRLLTIYHDEFLAVSEFGVLNLSELMMNDNYASLSIINSHIDVRTTLHPF